MKALLWVSLLTLLSLKTVYSQDKDTIFSTSTAFSTVWTNQDFDSVMTFFTQETIDRAKLSPTLLETIWNQLEDRCGKFQSKGAIEAGTENGMAVASQVYYFENESLLLKIVYNDLVKITGFVFVPNPAEELELVKTDSIWEEETVVKTGRFKMRGIITYPYKDAKYPALVLVHGSGPNDMDESYGPNKLFKELAHDLAEKGIVVLRYDKRTKTYGGKPELKVDRLTLEEETIDDALSAVKLLSKNPRVDKSRIYVLGHSLGGMAAPQIAKAGKKVAGIIIMAGNARPLEDVVLSQLNYLALQDGAIDSTEQAEIEAYKVTLKSLEELRQNGKTSGSLPLGLPLAYWKYLINYDQLTTARNLDKPILILQGERDYQVTLEDFNLWKEKLGKQPKVTCKKYAKLNHLMREGKGKSYPDEYLIKKELPSYLSVDIANWIKLAGQQP